MANSSRDARIAQIKRIMADLATEYAGLHEPAALGSAEGTESSSQSIITEGSTNDSKKQTFHKRSLGSGYVSRTVGQDRLPRVAWDRIDWGSGDSGQRGASDSDRGSSPGLGDEWDDYEDNRPDIDQPGGYQH